jgi:DNA (cytosine-5)-methyltransferase 1
MKVLVLYCCGGGSSMGYHNLGFDVTGVDIKKKRYYPFKQIKGDCLEIVKDVAFLKHFDFIHASPPCQTHSRANKCSWGETSSINHIPQIREALINSKVPAVIENVPGSDLNNPVMLCGSMFDLKVRRHRLFELINWDFDRSLIPKCNHKKQGKPIGVYGSMGDTVKGVCKKTGKTVLGGSTAKNIEEAREAMGIDWLNWRDLTQAIPPKYTEFIGKQFMK